MRGLSKATFIYLYIYHGSNVVFEQQRLPNGVHKLESKKKLTVVRVDRIQQNQKLNSEWNTGMCCG